MIFLGSGVFAGGASPLMLENAVKKFDILIAHQMRYPGDAELRFTEQAASFVDPSFLYIPGNRHAGYGFEQPAIVACAHAGHGRQIIDLYPFFKISMDIANSFFDVFPLEVINFVVLCGAPEIPAEYKNQQFYNISPQHFNIAFFAGLIFIQHFLEKLIQDQPVAGVKPDIRIKDIPVREHRAEKERISDFFKFMGVSQGKIQKSRKENTIVQGKQPNSWTDHMRDIAVYDEQVPGNYVIFPVADNMFAVPGYHICNFQEIVRVYKSSRALGDFINVNGLAGPKKSLPYIMIVIVRADIWFIHQCRNISKFETYFNTADRASSGQFQMTPTFSGIIHLTTTTYSVKKNMKNGQITQFTT
jgi:hypothetical protein